MPPGLMSRRKSRHMVWEMGNREWGMGIGDWRMGNGAAGKCFRRKGERGQPIIPIAPPEPL